MKTITFSNSFLFSDIELVAPYFNKYRPDVADVLTEERLQSLKDVLKNISSQNGVFVMVGDVIKERVIFAVDEKKIVGYDLSLYVADNGIQFSTSHIHPDFFYAAVTMHTTALEYLIDYEGTGLSSVFANYDGLYKRSNGEYFHFLQQSVCIHADHNGNPLLFLTYVHDITHLKKEKTANLVMSSPEEKKLWNFNFTTNHLDPIKPLSRQEIKVLNYLAKGKSSKEIAKELFISPFTVDTHRRNLLESTNCINTTGLVTYAKLVGLI